MSVAPTPGPGTQLNLVGVIFRAGLPEFVSIVVAILACCLLIVWLRRRGKRDRS